MLSFRYIARSVGADPVSSAKNVHHNETQRCSQNITHTPPGKQALSVLAVEIPKNQ
jgi:hypothetical protein